MENGKLPGKSVCQTSILETIVNWEFPKKVKVDFVFLKGCSKMYYEKILNQKPNGTVSQGIITEASPLVCGQSVPCYSTVSQTLQRDIR